MSYAKSQKQWRNAPREAHRASWEGWSANNEHRNLPKVLGYKSSYKPMRRFVIRRVAHEEIGVPDAVIVEGVAFSAGPVVAQPCTVGMATQIYQSIEAMRRSLGHSKETIFQWIDEDTAP